ncbi:MAG: glutamine synthetase adenylyltransferase [Anaerolineae bacterium]|nr:glutamine synthetase adenylyltransferase [Anaerolineae bacterium]
MFYERARELLFEQLSAEVIRQWLIPLGIADWRAAHRCLLRIAQESQAAPALADLLPYLLPALADAANPDRVLVGLERFVRSTPDKAGMVGYLATHPRAVEILVTLFAGSQFLTEILLRNPEYFSRLVEHRSLSLPKSVAQFEAEAKVASFPDGDGGVSVNVESRLDAMRRFQRWELLRIGACDLLGLLPLSVVTSQLSNLADSVVQTCLAIAAAQTSTPADGFVVLAMGKHGGRELNYSSDIDLLFLAKAGAENYLRLAERLISGLTQVTGEGFLYRVDMRLRPWGQTGALVVSVDSYLVYLDKHARLWEKQALLKARAAAGDLAVGEAFLTRAMPLIFEEQPLAVRAGAHAMKQRTEAYLRQRGRDWGDVKLGEGSIRDVEFVIQYLQMIYGAQFPEIRSRNTLDALARAIVCRILAPEDYRVLADGYTFLRAIEHHLQMMHYRQTHALPDDPIALAHLARRLGFQGKDAGAQFLAHYEQHRMAVRAVYLHHLGEGEMGKLNPAERSLRREPLDAESSADAFSGFSAHVLRMDPAYTTVFSPEDMHSHALLAAQLDANTLVKVSATPLADRQWRVTIVAYDYLGELSLICGLLFVYGCSIRDGDVFTYEPASTAQRQESRRKIVDVFTVYPERKAVTAETWLSYEADLAELLRLMHEDRRREARGILAKRWADSLRDTPVVTTPLYPIDIQFDNEVSERYTLMHIDAPDTSGFLYEFTNALAYSRIHIARMSVDSIGPRVHDILYVTDANGKKITAPKRQHQLRVASVLIKHFTHLLPQSPNPESALLHFREFVEQRFRRENWTAELASLERPEVLNALARLLGVSDFLWEDFLRMQYANLFPVVRDLDALHTMKTREQLQAALEATLRPIHDGPQPPSDDAPWREALNAFKDREMFRIDMRHILGHTQEFGDFSEELTALVEVVVNAAYHLCHEDLRSVYGTPQLAPQYTENGDMYCDVSEMTVFALGKCGGRELGFASDIELMFIYAGNGHTSGPNVISTAEFYEKLVQTFVGAIRARREGIFEIDLQLRPYGKSGSMAVSLEAFSHYYAPDGPAWAYERQALVKLRPIAGNSGLGQHVAALRDGFIYTTEPFDVAAMRAMRERQVRHLVTGGTFNAKFSPGGLVDVEYLVQGLQITHGYAHPELRLTNGREAMAALANAGILSDDDYTWLRKAHTFLHWLIDGLRMVHGNNKDLTVPPANSEAFAFLARRLRYGDDVDRLRDELARYTVRVQGISARLLG